MYPFDPNNPKRPERTHQSMENDAMVASCDNTIVNEVNLKSTGLFDPCTALGGGGGGVFHPSVKSDPDILES